jgi:glucokinase
MNTLAIDIGGTKLALGLFSHDLFPGDAAAKLDFHVGQLGKLRRVDNPPDFAIDNRAQVSNLPHRLVRRELRATDRSGGPRAMLEQISEVVHEWRRDHRIDACGIGFGGPVDFASQRVVLSTHVEGWRDFDLIGSLHAILPGAKITMDNDANMGALGESIYGAGRDFRPLFYMTLSTGIGGGIVLPGGNLLRGADSYAGEIGHITIRPDGPECLCGARGCFERMCCGLWLERDYGKPPSELLQDPAFVAHYVEDVALGLKSAIMVLNPARIVIGGGIAKAGDRLFVPLRSALKRHITAWSRARIDVVPAALGEDSVLWGAAALANS